MIPTFPKPPLVRPIIEHRSSLGTHSNLDSGNAGLSGLFVPTTSDHTVPLPGTITDPGPACGPATTLGPGIILGTGTRPEIDMTSVKISGLSLGTDVQITDASLNSGESSPSTYFYLVCGGEMTPEQERQSREQMDMIYKIIVEKGLARDDQIMFVSGRGGKLNSASRSNHEANGFNFNMYGPETKERPPSLKFPTCNDNAVVIFIGEGNTSTVGAHTISINEWELGSLPLNEGDGKVYFGDLTFVSNRGHSSYFRPHLADLKAKRTIFISLADYTERAFERAFDCTLPMYYSRDEKLLAICLSGYFHAPSENFFGKAFEDFFEGDTWKEKTISDFCDMLEEKYLKHPEVQETRRSIEKLNSKERFEEERRERSAWATGSFEHMMNLETISDQEWELFQGIETLKQTLEGADEKELSPNLREKLEETFSKIDTVRVDLTETKLLRPKAYKVVGDKDFSSMKWKDFLKLN